MYYTNHYVIDWEKVQTLDDIKLLLQSLQITFEPNCSTLETIKHLVHLEPKGKVFVTMD